MAERSYAFPKSHRLVHANQFDAVYAAKVRETRGPLTIFGLPNDLGHLRLGLSVPRRVGTAPKRNRVKRLLREAFRLLQHDLPRGYDLVINVRPHDGAMLADYQRMLSAMVLKLHRTWEKRMPPESGQLPAFDPSPRPWSE